MYIPCWNCGNDVWFETQFECRHCSVPVRRCADCTNFAEAQHFCRALHVDVNPIEAEKPTSLSPSYRCVQYQQSVAAAQHASSLKGRATPAPAASAEEQPSAAGPVLGRPVQQRAAALAPESGPHLQRPTAPLRLPGTAEAAPAEADASSVRLQRPTVPLRLPEETGAETAPPEHPPATPTPPPTPSISAEERPEAPAEAARPRRRLARIVAHRGDPSRAPENTLASFARALQVGVWAVELDVHMTQDGVPVVIHDSSVDRCSDGEGRVRDLTLAELKRLDAGAWFDAQFAGERIPTLEEAAQAIPAPVWLQVHLRHHDNESDRFERAVLEAVQRQDAVGRTCFTHGARHSLHRLRELEPKCRVCWLPRGGEQDVEYVDDAYYMHYRIIQPVYRIVNQAFVDYAHARQMWVQVFWADDAESIRSFVDMGADAILTNYPQRMRDVLQAAAAQQSG